MSIILTIFNILNAVIIALCALSLFRSSRRQRALGVSGKSARAAGIVFIILGSFFVGWGIAGIVMEIIR